jgi:predicted ATPase
VTIVDELVAKAQKKFAAGEFDKFIHEMYFPKFKGFAANTKIEFRFPITLLVGPNGGGKSSLLHAAWGMPINHSTSRFWFSTPVDPIDFDEKDQNRYWYAHYIRQLKLIVHTRKMCGNKRNGYWEPTRPAQKEGMKMMPQKTAGNEGYMSPTGDRWKPVDRTPHYFNAKTESSAFDRIFYSTASYNLSCRQENFVRYSNKLKKIIEGSLATFEYYGVERVSENYLLSPVQLKHVNDILQKNYRAARYIKHKLYDKDSFSPSVVFETNARSYSECFAGSGELAVVNYVLALEKLKDFDLLLLDEPETSLHPGAQKKLTEHLLRVVNEKHIQVIISTHSPTFVELLPSTALVVLDEAPEGVSPRLNPKKSAAFEKLGQTDPTRITILTEDKLLKAVVERALTRIPKKTRDKVSVFPSELGASEMLSHQIRAHIQCRSKVIMVLDGDQKAVEDIFNRDPKNLSSQQKDEIVEELKKLNVSLIGSKVDIDGWLNWCKKHIVLLDRICPEQMLLELLAPEHPLLSSEQANNSDFKSAAKSVLQNGGNESSTDGQYYMLKIKLGEIKSETPLDKSIENLATKINHKLEDIINNP